MFYGVDVWALGRPIQDQHIRLLKACCHQPGLMAWSIVLLEQKFTIHTKKLSGWRQHVFFQYSDVLVLITHRYRWPTPCHDMQPHTMTDPEPCFSVSMMYSGLYFLPLQHLTMALLVPQKTWKELSSLHKTRFHSLTSQFLWAWENCILHLQYAEVQRGFLAATQPHRSAFCGPFLIMVVSSSTSWPSCMAFLRSDDVKRWFPRDIRIRILSCFAVAFLGLSWRGRSATELVSRCFLIISLITVRLIPMSSAIFWYECPPGTSPQPCNAL